ncbi:MAG: hypothetical protein ABH871_07925 [Pseudomonadota bacterium]
MNKTIILLVTALLIVGCANSQLVGQAQDPNASASGLRTFALASDFPADIVIPDIAGMRSTAFVVSVSDPSAVLAIDIDADPLVLSTNFAGLSVPPGSGIPARLIITASDQAFLLTSLGIISFNPTSGAIYDQVSSISTLDIGNGLLNSDGTQASSTITPAFPAGITRIGNRLFISTANYIQNQTPAITAPGTVQAFEVNANRTLTNIGHFVTTGFNPTGLSNRNDDELIVVNSGVIDIIDATGVPQTDASIDIVDPETLTIKSNIPIGLAALSPYGMAITIDGSRGFVGSAAYGHVYEIDLINKQVLRGIDDPIYATEGSDYITAVALLKDDSYLFAASFEQSSVIPFDLAQTDLVGGNPFVVGYPAGVTDENPTGANTGAGPIAVRPGSRDVDYTGEDLFVLTGYPGTLVAVNTGAPAQSYVPTPSESDDDVEDAVDDETPVPEPPSGTDGQPCQGFAQAIHSVSYGAAAGFGQSLLPDIVLGPPRGNGAGSGSLHVLSLGKGGQIILDLGTCPAVDDAGEDFIVFENAFYIGGNPQAPYAELATVGVSNDGINFTDFPCSSGGYPYTGCAGWHAVFSHPENEIDPFDPSVAGGDAFDLADIGVAKARYVRIVDDGDGPSVGTTAGFDLDAIAVVNGEIEN